MIDFSVSLTISTTLNKKPSASATCEPTFKLPANIIILFPPSLSRLRLDKPSVTCCRNYANKYFKINLRSVEKLEQVSIYFEVSKDAGMGKDEQGNPCEIFAKIDLGKLNPEWRENMVKKLGEHAITRLASELGSFNQEYLREITKEEYERENEKVNPGQIIIADNERYMVHEIWPSGASTCIDFTAKRTEAKGIDINGNPVYEGRGFSYAVKNWELEESNE